MYHNVGYYQTPSFVHQLWLFALRKNMRWKERWKVLDIFAYLILLIVVLAWENMVLSLDGIWYLSLAFQWKWYRERLLDTRLDITLTSFLDWHFKIKFGTCEGYLVGFSLDTLVGLMIFIEEGLLIGLSLGLPLGYPLQSLNYGADLPVTLLVAHLGLWFFSKMFRCLYFCLRLMDFHESFYHTWN